MLTQRLIRHGDHYHCPPGVLEPSTVPSSVAEPTSPLTPEESAAEEKHEGATSTECVAHGDHWQQVFHISFYDPPISRVSHFQEIPHCVSEFESLHHDAPARQEETFINSDTEPSVIYTSVC